jgi:hypothetical protein
MSEAGQKFVESYAAAFAEYLQNPGEAALAAAYELGREAVQRELSVLELATTHYDVLDTALARPGWARADDPARAGRDFFLESLSAFEMVQRGYREAQEAALVERRHAAILRQLSNFLADASLALDAAGSIDEMLQLVVEQARELIGARGCVARLDVSGAGEARIAARGEAHDGALAPATKIAAPLVGGDGSELGVIELSDKEEGDFSEADVAVLVHLAQMAAAAVERVQLYRRDRATAEILARGRLPASLPETPGLAFAARYRPANPPSAGGGWYDVVALPDGSTAVGIGDVAGGPAAAAAAGHVRAAFRAAVSAADPPAMAVERIGIAVAGLDARKGSTMLYALVEPAAGIVRLASAGHAPAVLWAPDGRPAVVDAPATLAVEPRAALVLRGGGASGLDLAGPGSSRLDPDALWERVLDALPERFESDATLLVVQFD